MCVFLLCVNDLPGFTETSPTPSSSRPHSPPDAADTGSTPTHPPVASTAPIRRSTYRSTPPAHAAAAQPARSSDTDKSRRSPESPCCPPPPPPPVHLPPACCQGLLPP